MVHLKRLVAPKTWQIRRKENVFTTKQYPRAKLEYSMPLALVVRDLLSQADVMREVKRVLNSRAVLINGKVRIEPKFPVCLFDILTVKKINKSYRVILNPLGKLALEEIKEPSYRISRIENKTAVKKGKIQLNLFDSTNVLVDKNDYKILDAVKLSIPENKVSGKIELKPGASVLIIKGKHIGVIAKVVSEEAKQKELVLETKEGSKIMTKTRNVHVM